jgi:hypothetical protein
VRVRNVLDGYKEGVDAGTVEVSRTMEKRAVEIVGSFATDLLAEYDRGAQEFPVEGYGGGVWMMSRSPTASRSFES